MSKRAILFGGWRLVFGVVFYKEDRSEAHYLTQPVPVTHELLVLTGNVPPPQASCVSPHRALSNSVCTSTTERVVLRRAS